MNIDTGHQSVVKWEKDDDPSVLTVMLPNGFTLNIWGSGRYQVWDLKEYDAMAGTGVVSQGASIVGALGIAKKALDERAKEMNGDGNNS